MIDETSVERKWVGVFDESAALLMFEPVLLVEEVLLVVAPPPEDEELEFVEPFADEGGLVELVLASGDSMGSQSSSSGLISSLQSQSCESSMYSSH